MEYWLMPLFITISALSIYYLFKNFNFFKRHGVIHVPPIPILGAIAPIVFRQTSSTDFARKLYNYNPDAKYYGFHIMTQPVILLRDPKLIKEIFIRNFQAFFNRSAFVDFNDTFITKNILSLQGQEWYDMRRLLNSAFTSSKIKTMFPSLSKCVENFVKFLSAIPVDGSNIDTKDAFTKFINDVIVLSIFGIKIDSMRNPTNKFYVYNKNTINFSSNASKLLISRAFPKLARILGFKFISDNMANLYKNSVHTTFFAHDTDNIVRPNMIQSLMDMKIEHKPVRGLSMDDIAAQAFALYVASFETSGTTLCFLAHEIAVHPNVQTKLWQEIDKVLKNTTEEVTYEAINQLEYLDAVIKEVLRMYGPVLVERVCGEAYELPPALPNEKSFILKKGMIVFVPINAIHHDEKYYDEPEKFCPERFLNDKRYHNSPYYMPFGIGPKMCIANRFSIVIIKMLMFHLLARYELRPCAKTTIPMRFCKKTLTMMPEGGFWLNIRHRNDIHPVVESTMTSDS